MLLSISEVLKGVVEIAQLKSLRTSLNVCFRMARATTRLIYTHRRQYSTQLYVQGNSPKPGIREYFYYIDHQGQLFLDDTKIRNFVTCFKDREFLLFFFKRLRLNTTGKYVEHFPYVSPCGRELNFIRCDDLPIVFTHIVDEASSDNVEQTAYHLVCNNVGPKLTYPFDPSKLYMLPESGRVYHTGPDKVGGVALVKSSLAIELSSHFLYEDGTDEMDPPSHIEWQGSKYSLDNHVKQLLQTIDRQAIHDTR